MQADKIQVLFEPSWGILELELASVMHRTIRSYGALYTGQDPSNLYKPVPLVSMHATRPASFDLAERVSSVHVQAATSTCN